MSFFNSITVDIKKLIKIFKYGILNKLIISVDGAVYFYLTMRDYIRELVQAKSKETIDMKEE